MGDYNMINGKPEHRVVVEKFIGRELRHHEVVHHLDENKKNNKISNLMIFKSQSAHQKFHNYIRQFGFTNNIKKQIENRWEGYK